MGGSFAVPEEDTRTGIVDGRCFWGASHADYVAYHDREWGFPVDDDRRLFEKLCLEGFQSGLSWLTILRKRENFRRAFLDFDFAELARWEPHAATTRLLQDQGIVRHRGKIEATLHNSRQACALADECGSLAAYFWRWEPAPQDRPRVVTRSALMSLAKTPASAAMAQDLKRRGFRFFGPTTAYAFMQAMGLVNDHIEGCAVRAEVEVARRRFHRPV